MARALAVAPTLELPASSRPPRPTKASTPPATPELLVSTTVVTAGSVPRCDIAEASGGLRGQRCRASGGGGGNDQRTGLEYGKSRDRYVPPDGC